MTPTLGKVTVCAGNYVSDYLMVFCWLRGFVPAYGFDTVLVAISIRLRGKQGSESNPKTMSKKT